MSELINPTDTELLKLLNECKDIHDKLKQEIIADTYEYDEYVLSKANEINKKIEKLDEYELLYIKLIEDLNNRNVIR